jgi:hypothetical protein
MSLSTTFLIVGFRILDAVLAKEDVWSISQIKHGVDGFYMEMLLTILYIGNMMIRQGIQLEKKQEVPSIIPKRSENHMFPLQKNNLLQTLTPHRTPPPQKPVIKILSDIIEHYRLIFSKSPMTFEKCSAPLIQLIQKVENDAITITELGNAKEDGLLPGQHVTMKDLFEDLLNCRNEESLKIQDPFRVTGEKGIAHLITAMSSDSKGLLGEETPVALGAVDIPAHAKGSKLIDHTMPYNLRDSGVCAEVTGGFMDKGSVITSPGYVSEPHWDYFGIQQQIIHAGGKKLWLVWQPTSENLRKAAEHLLCPSKSVDFTISVALEELTDLKIYFCTKQDDWFSMEPSAIHAVFTVTPSAHKSKLFVDYGTFEKWEEAYCIIIDTMISKYQKQNGNDEERKKVIQEIIDSTKAFCHWDVLLEKIPDHPLASITQSRLDKIKGKIDSILMALGCANHTKKRPSNRSIPGAREVKRSKKN